MSEARLKEIVAFRKAGHSYNSIASRMGISRNVVAGVIYRAGLTNHTGARSAARRETGGVLSRADVLWARRTFQPYHPWFSISAMARQLGVNKKTLHHAVRGKTWGWLTPAAEREGRGA